MTPAQPLAVFEHPLEDITLIEASAGTGKTWNICGLVLRLLLEKPLEVQQILVVTFTNAATAELRERIRSRIVDTLEHLQGTGTAPEGDEFVAGLLARQRSLPDHSDEKAAERLRQALQTFDEAAIFTIHGFCQRALADTPFSAALPMRMELLTDDDALHHEVACDFWRRHIAHGSLAPELAARLSAKGDSPERWARLVRRHAARPLARVLWPEGVDAPGTTEALARELRLLHARARQEWHAHGDAIVAGVAAALDDLPRNVYQPAALETAASAWRTALATADPLALPAGLEKLELLGSRKLVPKKGRTGPAPHPFFDLAQDWLDTRDALARTLDLQRLALIRRLVQEGPPRVAQLKRERRVVAFDDMLANLHARLVAEGGQALAGELRRRFPAALIDEFQDTDPLQLAIFRALYEHTGLPLFLVGDPKQAIYSFRHADLPTYLQARRIADQRRTLLHNQRSSDELIAALNALYGINPRPFMLEGLDYPPAAPGKRRPQRLEEAGSPPRAALQLWSLPHGEDGDPLPRPRAIRACVEATAGEIARLLAAGRRREACVGGQPVVGGHIAVLVRSHRQGALVRQALAVVGVGSIEVSQASVFMTPDAEELEQLLAAVLEPGRERLMRAALATTLMGRSAADIDRLSTDEAGHLRLAERFAQWRELWLRRGVALMLRQWMADEGVAGRLLARPDGERRLTDLRHLCECLHEAGGEHPTAEALLRWLRARRREPRADEATQLRLESDRDLVKIVTIHKSKGLEYPLVFLPFAWDPGRPGRNDAEGLEYHDDEGRSVIDYGAQGTPAAADARRRIALERAAEDLRLLYVALTRAVHRCTVVIGAYRSGRVTKPSRAALPNWLVEDSQTEPGAWLDAPPDGDLTRARWTDFARRHPGLLSLSSLPTLRPQALPREAVEPAALVLAAPLPSPRAAWRIGSYSSLVKGARHETAAVDHDARAPSHETQTPGMGAGPVADDDILRFPRGARAGECLHAAFEHAEFTDAGSWPDAADRALREHLFDEPAAAAQWRLQLLSMLGDVMRTPLASAAGTLCLGDVARGRRIAEMEFHLPARRLDPQTLAALLARRGMPAPTFGAAPLSGYLRGFIDLVFEHQGRVHVIDWKSNHLGERTADYAHAGMAAEMARHDYHLQALLYAVALHRHLQRRRPGYRFDTHFGGVHYLFVRGVRPGWRQADGRPSGVFDLPFDASLVEAASALLE
jgi:exodeoxyribonuclease V beta subunit